MSRRASRAGCAVQPSGYTCYWSPVEWLGKLKTEIAQYALVSSRALAGFRWALGLVCCANVLYYWLQADVFFTESGVYPSSALEPWYTSLLRGSENAGAHVYFATTAALALAFACGVPGVKWVLPFFHANIFQRAPGIVTGAQAVLQLALVYSWLLPVERDWSLGAFRRDGTWRTEPVFVKNWGYPLILLQLAVNYGFNAFNKRTPEWEEGVALARALENPSIVQGLGVHLSDLPASLFAAAGFVVLALESVLPLLLLTPLYRRSALFIAGTLMILLHGLIALTLEVGTFSWAMMAHVPLLFWRPTRTALPRVELVQSNWKRRAQQLGCLVCLYLMLFSLGRRENSAGVNRYRAEGDLLPLPQSAQRMAHFLNLHQGWGMFARPLDRTFVTVVHAETRSGRVFDPWRTRAANEKAPRTTVPRQGYARHMFANYEGTMLMAVPRFEKPFANWVMLQTHPEAPDDPVVRFAAFTLSVPTDRKHQKPLEVIEDLSGLRQLPFPGHLPTTVSGFGVWKPERASDGRIVDDGSHVMNPVGSAFSPGCAHLLFDLQKPQDIHAALLQADAADVFLAEVSANGVDYKPAHTFSRIEARQYRTRTVNFEPPLTGVRYVRLRPERPRHRRGHIAEVALFSQPLPPVRFRLKPETHFLANYENPAAFGTFNATSSGLCPWDTDLAAAEVTK